MTTVKVSCSSPDIEPQKSFEEKPFDPKLRPIFAGFKEPTDIQKYAWPALRSGRNVVGVSATGSGKTLAFSLPILEKLLRKHLKEDGDDRKKDKKKKEKIKVRWLTLAPTRELAVQTYNVIKSVIPAVCLYGGVPKHEQLRELGRVKPLAIIATPGRLEDILMSDPGAMDLSKCKYLVLDEADRMLDVGFEPAINRIINDHLPGLEKRQTVLFSATWPLSVQKMAVKYAGSDGVIKLQVHGADADMKLSSPSASLDISQTVHVVKDHRLKDEILLRTLAHFKNPNDDKKAIVFVLYKKEAPRVEGLLKRQRFSVSSLHGDMTQADRNHSMESFRQGKIKILVATDVAARGLDINDVALVFNYTFPLTIEDYVHRIGRTGRGGAKGQAVTLFTDNEKHLAGALQNVLRQAKQEIPKDLLAYHGVTKRKVHSEYGAHFKDPLEGGDGPMPQATKIKFDSDSE